MGNAAHKKDSRLQEEVKDLVNAVSIEEAMETVWKKFEKALGALSPESAEFFSDYLSGRSQEELAKKFKIDIAAVQMWLDQVKRQIGSQLRNHSTLRQ